MRERAVVGRMSVNVPSSVSNCLLQEISSEKGREDACLASLRDLSGQFMFSSKYGGLLMIASKGGLLSFVITS